MTININCNPFFFIINTIEYKITLKGFFNFNFYILFFEYNILKCSNEFNPILLIQ